MIESDPTEAHWQRVYARGEPSGSRWFQGVPTMSLELVDSADLDPEAPIIDVGGGPSRLVDHLLRKGYSDLTVLDVSADGLALARDRLGPLSDDVHWIEADVTAFIPERTYALWHDRALFHFLTDPVDRALYAAVLYEAVEPGGRVVIGTFASDGPDVCSGLPTCRYDAPELAAELGGGFELVDERREQHRTPDGETQAFCWTVLRRRSDV